MALDEELRTETKRKLEPVFGLITHVCDSLPSNREKRAFLKLVKGHAYRLTEPLLTTEERSRRATQSEMARIDR